MTELDQYLIDHALRVAAQSPCRSKRGVVLFDPGTGAYRGSGFNGPPDGCPGRAVCAGSCGKRSVHAESRALREAARYIPHHPPGPYDLVHVELAADVGVVACDGPRCWQCSREILDVGFVAGVWLYEHEVTQLDGSVLYSDPRWRRYTAADFHQVTLKNCGITP